MALLSSDVDVIRLTLLGVSALTERRTVGPRLGAVEPTVVTCKERGSTLKLQARSKDTGKAAEKTQMSNLEGHVMTAEGCVSLISATLCELMAKLPEAEAVRYIVLGALRSAEAGLILSLRPKRRMEKGYRACSRIIPISTINVSLQFRRSSHS